jgi:hypothetical protein
MSNQEFIKGNMKIVFENGEWFEGEIYKGKFEGYGKYGANGILYESQFR